MTNPCTGLVLMIIIASAVPAILCSIAIIMALLMLDKINGRDALLLIIVVVVLAFVPLIIDYLFGKQMPGNLSQCLQNLDSKTKKMIRPAPAQGAQMQMPRAPAVMSKTYNQSPPGPATVQTPSNYYPGASNYYPSPNVQSVPYEEDYLKSVGL